MKGKQDKKPDFLKDINENILEKLTERNIENIAGLAGNLKKLSKVSDICGLEFNGYLAEFGIPRPSGIADEVVIAFTENEVDRGKCGDGLCIENYFLLGRKILVSGKQQTLKDFETGKVLVFVLADYIGLSPKAEFQNDIALVGKLAYKPVFRQTTRGKKITNIFVETKNSLTGGKSLIPCICWEDQAETVENWNPGDKVKLYGRCQSRQYSKLIDDITGEREIRTAYEVSVHLIKREEK